SWLFFCGLWCSTLSPRQALGRRSKVIWSCAGIKLSAIPFWRPEQHRLSPLAPLRSRILASLTLGQRITRQRPEHGWAPAYVRRKPNAPALIEKRRSATPPIELCPISFPVRSPHSLIRLWKAWKEIGQSSIG